MIDLARSNDPYLCGLLRSHPKVRRVEAGPAPLSFWQGSWERNVHVGDYKSPLYGLTELMDNNPLVCADTVSIPSPMATLGLIALGPLADAGLLVDGPTFVASEDFDPEELSVALHRVGWPGGVVAHSEPIGIEPVLAATAMAVIRTPDDLDEIDDVYAERFGRSFFVRRHEEGEWTSVSVSGQPFAHFRLAIAPDEPNSLLTIRVLADSRGKAGAAQIVHAMNVMAGLEESLGI